MVRPDRVAAGAPGASPRAGCVEPDPRPTPGQPKRGLRHRASTPRRASIPRASFGFARERPDRASRAAGTTGVVRQRPQTAPKRRSRRNAPPALVLRSARSAQIASTRSIPGTISRSLARFRAGVIMLIGQPPRTHHAASRRRPRCRSPRFRHPSQSRDGSCQRGFDHQGLDLACRRPRLSLNHPRLLQQRRIDSSSLMSASMGRIHGSRTRGGRKRRSPGESAELRLAASPCLRSSRSRARNSVQLGVERLYRPASAASFRTRPRPACIIVVLSYNSSITVL
jgi:hypothetical protein